MHGIDISAWQDNIDLNKVDYDFCFVKATEGTDYTNSHYAAWGNTVLNRGKKLGFYHYSKNGDAEREAEFFWNAVKEYDEAVLALDYEENVKPAWALRFLKRLESLSGQKPVIYTSWSIATSHDWSKCKNYPLWIAAYPEPAITSYKKPTDLKTHGAWNEVAIRQYTSSGKLPGYSGRLDLNYCYTDLWKKNSSTTKKKNSSTGFGEYDVKQLQDILGVAADGIISAQAFPAYFPDLTAYDRGIIGSPTVRALQAKLGVKSDGLLGPSTVKALQYMVCVTVDGVWGAETSEALRKFMKLSKARRELLFSCQAMTAMTKGWKYDAKATYVTYNKAKKHKRLNCALAVTYAMQRAGILPATMRIWLGKDVNSSGAKYVEEHCRVGHPNKLTPNVDLTPGDIAGYQWGSASKNYVHTMVYVGDYGGHPRWYTWGSSDVKLGKTCRRRSTYEKRKVRTLVHPAF